MHRTQCEQCGLVNFATSETCRRCGALCVPAPLSGATPIADTSVGGRSLWQWLLWTGGVTVLLLVTSYASLLVTSDGLAPDQQAAVSRAIVVLQQAGFSREATVLGRFVSWRGTDNWWNAYVGHQRAYAATNYPFAVITVYPPFFTVAVDDTERAAILLHEAYHVLGDEEDEALRRVWLTKRRIGWIAERYAGTRVWKNTREWTAGEVPGIFRCGVDGASDCYSP
jgi:hypothetical protein